MSIITVFRMGKKSDDSGRCNQQNRRYDFNGAKVQNKIESGVKFIVKNSKSLNYEQHAGCGAAGGGQAEHGSHGVGIED